MKQSEVKILTPVELSEQYKDFRELIIASEDLYPGIEAWFDKYVKPDLKTGK